MSRPWVAILPLILAALLGAGACLVFQSLSSPKSDATHAHGGAGNAADYHQWMHAQLGISEEQDAALHPIEEDFEQKRNALTEQIRKANAELGHAMQKDKAKTPRVDAILVKIHEAQTAIQEETIRHFFDMKPHLTEAQFEKLLALMTDALHGTPHSHSD
jgi:nickel and cobalt resistance protein CnrR